MGAVVAGAAGALILTVVGVLALLSVPVYTVLAVRRYQDKPVPEATVRRIVEAARLTDEAVPLAEASGDDE